MDTKTDSRVKNKSLVTFSLDFTDEQKEARKVCHQNIVTVLHGKPGTSKTTIAASVALELLMRKPKETDSDARMHGKYSKIIITRPTEVNGKDLGFLPGDASQKLAPFTEPVFDVIRDLLGRHNDPVKDFLDKGQIEIVPLQFMRGRTFRDAIVILDEGQNAGLEDFKLISSRLGKNSKLLVTSDWRQIDLKQRNKSACMWYDKVMHLDGCGSFELTENFRHPLAIQIMDTLIAGGADV